jgi:uncharacterized cupredoxin-like copper-binding protein
VKSDVAQDIQKRTIKVLATTQILSGVGVAGTVAAGSLLVSSISNSETLAGLSQTTAVLGAAAMAIPLSKLTQRGGRRLGLSVGYTVGLIGAAFAIFGGSQRILIAMLIGTFLVGAASASGYQARFAATDLADDSNRSRQLSYVVWGSTVGAVTGPNLMGPSGALAESLGLPTLVGPYSGAVPNAGSKQAVVQPVLNSSEVNTMGTQYIYVKPSVLSTKGMLEKRYRWAYNGQYPNYWVQPNYTGNQTDSASQGLYVQNLAAANTCNLKVNNVGTYEGYKVGCGPTLCTPGRSTARFKYNDMARNGPNTKILGEPVSYVQDNLNLTKKC